MPKAVLDSSILVSAFIAWQSELMLLLRLPLRHRYELVLSKEILGETAQSLLTKQSIRDYAEYTDEDVHGYLSWLLSVTKLVDKLPELSAVPNDPKDNMVIATAMAGKADYLVTGDRRHLLPMKEYQGIVILSPRSFLDLLESEHGATAA
jgi:putative PIN family toxin of toxin-antitoxin system